MKRSLTILLLMAIPGIVMADETPDRRTVDLEEVVVKGDRSKTVQRLPDGQRFFLSDKAKAMNDPFMALQEIPLLSSDPANSSVTTLDGNTPLIMIDGKEVNSGIAPILPEDIESVDVIDVVSAKYLAAGVRTILNINLRKNRPPYIWTELATRHELPIRRGMGVGYFEVGTEKASVYGRASYRYTYHDDTDGRTDQLNTGYMQTYDWKNRAGGNSWLGELLLKLVPDTLNYFAIQAYVTRDVSNSSMRSEGTFTTHAGVPYTADSEISDKGTILTTSAYYRHAFTSVSDLTVKGSFNYNENTLATYGQERYGADVVMTDAFFDNSRRSGSVDLTYQNTFRSAWSLEAGSAISLTNDHISVHPHPLFRHHNYREYIYASMSGQHGMWYMYGSIGMECTWLRAGEESNRYIRPNATVSITRVLNPSNSLQLSYFCTNSAPDARMLNPYNISTDPLVTVRGNPSLTPSMNQSAVIAYTFSKGGFYMQPNGGATLVSDLITASGYTDSDGVYVNTFANQGRFANTFVRFNVSQRLTTGKVDGRIYGGAQWLRKFYTGCTPKDEYTFSCGLNIYWHKFYFGLDAEYSPRSYSDISMTKNLNLSSAQAQVNYNITPNLYVAVGLQGYTGMPRARTFTDNGTFHFVNLTRTPELGFHPWILIRWNMRKHTNRRIKLDKVLNSTESGLRLK